VQPREGDTNIVRLIGDANALGTILLKSKLKELADTGPSKVVIDMSELRYIGSGALGVLLIFSREVSTDGCKPSICAPQDAVRKMLNHLSMHKMMPVFDTLEDALAED